MSDYGRPGMGLVDNRLSLGRVVSQTFGVLGRNLVAVGAIAFIVSVLVVVMAGVVAALARQAVQGGGVTPNGAIALAVGAGFAVLFIGIVVRSVSTGGITHIAVSDLNEQRATVGQALSTGLRLALPLLGLSIVVGLGVGLAFLLLVVPGVMLAMRWAVAIPARVVEGPPMGSALARSSELTKGSRWRIFFLFVFLGLFGLAVTAATNGVAFALFGANGDITSTVAAGILQVIGGTIGTSVGSTGIAVLYAELRRVREGAMPSQLAAVFA